jgi:ParB family chromosome partitioning protein
VTRKALGRGLSALIPGGETRPATGGQPEFFLCPIERIQHAKGQPRQYFDEARLEELAASIREQGVVQPLVVRPTRDGKFVLVAGERRWRAAQRAGLHDVPVVIKNVSDLQAFELALVENLQREDLNPIEEAEAYRRLCEEHGYTQDQLGARLGRDRSTLANSLRLLKLPESVREAVIAGALSAGHARALLGLEKPAQLKEALRLIQAHDLSVRQTEALVKRLRQTSTPAPPPPRSPNVRDLEERLGESLKTRVRLHATSPDKGRIEIAYSSLDELDRILEVLLK